MQALANNTWKSENELSWLIFNANSSQITLPNPTKHNSE